MPALSIALVDDQKIVWAQGYGFADAAKKTGHRRDRLSRRQRVEAVHRPRRHAAGRARHPRPRRSGHEIPARFQADQPLRQAHHPAAADVAPLRPGARAARRQLFRSHRAVAGRTVESLNRTELVYEPETKTKYSNAGIAVVGFVLEETQKQRFRPLSVTNRCSSRWA